jgi:hypothetical protein
MKLGGFKEFQQLIKVRVFFFLFNSKSNFQINDDGFLFVIIQTNRIKMKNL